MKIPYKILLLTPCILIIVGIAANVAVQLANHQHMPVLFPGGDCPVLPPHEVVHACMTQATHLKFLGDIIMDDHALSSIGDVLQDFGTAIAMPAFVTWVFLIVRSLFVHEK